MNFKYIKYLDNKFLNGFIYKIFKKIYLNNKIKKSQTDIILNMNSSDKFSYASSWNNYFSHVIKNSLEGDIVECGVGDGFHLSFILNNMKTNYELKNKKYFGFDSFEGFPEPSEEDISQRNPKKGDWGHTDENYVLNNLIKIGFDETDFKNIKFIKGYFNKTLKDQKNLIDQICLLHLDCDLYQSYKDSLEFLYPKVVKNGLIIFDEYLDQNDFPGAIKAIDEFFGENIKNIQKCNASGKYYIIKK